ncbi:MAG TPA: hypothetical protein VHV08_09300 [Pirellulales bacterium]|jgi:hypothetical protein|nr:hypothetical protein [Pirellulales bacterium]
MGKYTLVVLTNSVAGKDEAFNDWYTNKHLADVISVPGFVSAQRFEMQGDPVDAQQNWRYLATYNLDCDDPGKSIAEMMRRAGTAEMPLSDGLDRKVYVALYEAITPLVAK